MLPRPSTPARALLAACAALAGLAAVLPAQVLPPEPIPIVAFDNDGRVENLLVLQTLRARVKKTPPKHIIVLAHGWKNSLKSAEGSYTKLVDSLKATLPAGALQADDYLIVGVHWHSLVFEDDSTLSATTQEINKFLSKHPKLETKITGLRTKLLDKLKGPDELRKRLFEAVRRESDDKFEPSVLENAPTEDEAEKEAEQGEGAAPVTAEKRRSLDAKKVIRLFSYYEMKQLADHVGSTGARRVLDHLRKEVPGAKVHLVGHSFGCKFWLACVGAGDTIDAPVDSLVLLQGAVSKHAFSPSIDHLDEKPAGAYRHVVDRVKGPIVVTFSRHDDALRQAYFVASQAAGQVGELPDRAPRDLHYDAYRALGSRGPGGDAQPLRKVNDAAGYKFDAGLCPVNGDDGIPDHNTVWTEPVARMIWAAVLRK